MIACSRFLSRSLLPAALSGAVFVACPALLRTDRGGPAQSVYRRT